jgi:hypothetical protein
MQSYIYYEATLSDKVTLIVSQCVRKTVFWNSDTIAIIWKVKNYDSLLVYVNGERMNKKSLILIISGVIIAALVLGACQAPAEQPMSEAEMAQQVAATRAAIATQNSIETLVAKVTELSIQPTNPPCPTCPACPTQPAATVAMPTSQVTGSPQPTATTAAQQPPAEGGRCLQFDFLGDASYPPGSVVSPGERFTKSWLVKNTGTCEWTREFDLVMSGGEAFGTNQRADIKNVVYPGDTVELWVEMIAPQTPGTYYSYWMLSAPDGSRVGYGPSQQWGLGVTIEVRN